MVKLREEKAAGYDEFQMVITKLRSESFQKIFVFFCGSLKDGDTGESWCQDCTKALPVIESGLHTLRGKLEVAAPIKVAYLFVSIERKEWRGNTKFRSDPKLHLTSLPTLILWEGNLEKVRLNEKECAVPEKVYSVLTV